MATVLIIEDDSTLARARLRQFQHAGYERSDLAIVEGAAEAVKAFKDDSNIRFVLSDMELKEGTGQDVFAGIESDLAIRKGLFIGITGDCPRDIRDFFDSHGVIVLDKPLGRGATSLLMAYVKMFLAGN